jgi:hypothetical protein
MVIFREVAIERVAFADGRPEKEEVLRPSERGTAEWQRKAEVVWGGIQYEVSRREPTPAETMVLLGRELEVEVKVSSSQARSVNRSGPPYFYAVF